MRTLLVVVRARRGRVVRWRWLRLRRSIPTSWSRSGVRRRRSRRTSRTSRRWRSTPTTRTCWSPGSNDEIDMEACNAGPGQHCPFTPGVGVSGVYFSFDSGTTWTQPTYTGLTRARLPRRRRRRRPAVHGARRPDRHAALVRREQAWSPTATRRSPSVRDRGPGGFSWANGSRLYYANLTSNVERHADRAGVQGLRGDRRVAHRRPAGRRGQRHGARGCRRCWSASSRARRSPTRSRSGPTTRRRARSSATSTSAGRRSAARRRATPRPRR